MKISVIIPAYNRPDLLEKTIKSIKAQSLKKTDFECILIYGFNKKVKEICKKISRINKNFSAYQVQSESPSKKRNLGLKKAKGSIIAFTDDDCLPEKNWLASITEQFKKNPKIVGVEGLTYTKGKKQLYSNAPVNKKGGLFPTCNLSFRKKLLDKINGFDESYHFYREDTDLAFRAMEHGKVIFSDKVRVFHPQRKVGLLRPFQTIFLLKEDIRLFKKSPEKYKKYLGKTFKIDLLKSAIGILLFLMLIIGIYINRLISSAGILAYVIFWLVIMKNQEKNVIEFVIFISLNFVKSILFPFYFIYYYLVIK